jgi:RNA recognition motif-containing protein
MKLELAVKDVKDAKEMKESKRVGKEKETGSATTDGKAAATKGAKGKGKTATDNDEEEAASKTGAAGSTASSMRIIVFGVPEAVSKKLLLPAVTKVSRKAQLELLKDDDPMCASLLIVTPAGRVMSVSAPSRNDATKVMAKLDGATIRGLALDASDAASQARDKLVLRRLCDITDPLLRKRKCRVIVRNLSFLATEANVADKLSKYGPLVEVNVPLVPVPHDPLNPRKIRKRKQREDGEPPAEKMHSRGFAFVTFLCEKDAASAVKQSAGLRVCNREVAIDFCMGKEVYERTNADGEVEGVEEEGEREVTELNEGEMGEEEDAEEEEGEGEGGEGGEEEGEGDDDVEGEEGDEDEMDEDEGADDDEEEEEEEEEEEQLTVSKEKRVVKDLDDVEEGCTVFVRDLPFDADQRDLRTAMVSGWLLTVDWRTVNGG